MLKVSHTLQHQQDFEPASLIPQLLLRFQDGQLVLLFPKIVEDMLFTGGPSIGCRIIEDSNALFTPVTVSHGPEHLRYFCIKILPSLNLPISVHVVNNLGKMSSLHIPRVLRRAQLSSL